MPKRVPISTLNARTIDILNVIRSNAPYEYQQMVPEVKTSDDIPKVGEIIMGYPAMANIFLNALVNRIALVRVRSATFNNMYGNLKKGFLEFGETIEEIFVNIAKVRTLDPEKAAARELKRTLPDVRSAFHVINWSAQYPVTIQDEDLKQAFLSIDGVQDLIARIVDSVYTAAEYDEFLLFKYMIIKQVSHGKVKPIAVDTSAARNAAVAFRATSNALTFMHSDYNEAGVLNTTPRDRQVIFMDSKFNAEFDVDVLSAAFNMDKADFIGRLYLIDDFTTFDNERFKTILDESTMIEEVTADELNLMKDVKAFIADEEYFQVYDNRARFTETYVASGEYWNYFYNVKKTISHSPFHNAAVFVADSATITLPESVTATVKTKITDTNGVTIFTLEPKEDTATLDPSSVTFLQTEDATKAGIAVHKYGAIIFPKGASTMTPKLSINGTEYTAEALTPATEQGAELAFSKA